MAATAIAIFPSISPGVRLARCSTRLAARAATRRAWRRHRPWRGPDAAQASRCARQAGSPASSRPSRRATVRRSRGWDQRRCKPQSFVGEGERLVRLRRFEIARLSGEQHGAAAERYLGLDIAVLAGTARVARAPSQSPARACMSNSALTLQPLADRYLPPARRGRGQRRCRCRAWLRGTARASRRAPSRAGRASPGRFAAPKRGRL